MCYLPYTTLIPGACARIAASISGSICSRGTTQIRLTKSRWSVCLLCAKPSPATRPEIPSSITLTRERAVLRTIARREQIETLRAALLQEAQQQRLTEVCLYLQSVSRLAAYIPELKQRDTAPRYRGAVISADNTR